MADTPAPFTILVVDDAEDVLDLVELTLKPHCAVKRAQDGRAALRLAFEKPRPDLMLLDVEMPGASGYDVCRALRAAPALADMPVIFLTSRSGAEDVIRGFELGAIDYLHKPINPPVLAARVRAHIELIARRNRQEELIVERSVQLERTRLQLIRRLGRAMEYHESSAVGNRVVRLSHYARHLAQAAGARAQLCDMMMKAAPLHDIGKLGVPASILRKTEKLTVPEREQMQRHAEIGAEIIGEHDDPLLKLSRTLALTHHERWDGSGYPSGAKGNDIPWPGRVMAVVDVFEGMTATQFHRKAITLDITAGEIVRGAGTQFDPQVVEAFKKALPAFREVHESYADALGDMLDLDFSTMPAPAAAPAAAPAKAPKPAEPEPPERSGEETMRTVVGNRALQALREAGDARARTLAVMQAKLKVDRDLAAAAARDLSTQQAARKRAEEAAAREAEALELARRRMAEESAAASEAQLRAKAEASAAEAARKTEAATALLIAETEARIKAQIAHAGASADRRAAEESLARTEASLKATLGKADEAALAKRMAEEAEEKLAAASTAADDEALRRAEARLAGALEQAALAERRLAEEAAAVRRMAAERAALDETIVALEQQLGAANERRSAGEAAVEKRIAEERHALEERLAALELDLDAANAKATAQSQAREKAEQALAAAATAANDEALHRAEVKLASALSRAAQAEKRQAEDAAAAAKSFEERAALEEKLATLERDLGAATAKAVTEAQARQKAEQALAAAARPRAAPIYRMSPAATRALVYAPVALAAAVVGVALYLSAVEETPVRAPKAAAEARVATPQSVAVLGDGEPLTLRLDRDAEKLAPREPK